MTSPRPPRVDVDAETHAALAELAQAQGLNVATLMRDILRAHLGRKGYKFTTTPTRYARRGTGRKGATQ